MKFRGSGLAEVRDHKCMGCQVMLRPQTYNEVRNGEQLVVCESCQRILHFDSRQRTEVRACGIASPREKTRSPQV